MVPPELFVFEGEEHKSGEDHECNHLLKHFELYKGKRSALYTGAYPVGGYLKAVFKKRDAPAEQNDRKQPEAFAPFIFFKLQMTIPGQCHKNIAGSQQQNGTEVLHSGVSS
jgi:hypothetical protein